MSALRTFVGTILIKVGMATVPSDVREMMRKMLLFHVPGALTDNEKPDVIAAKNAWRKSP